MTLGKIAKMKEDGIILTEVQKWLIFYLIFNLVNWNTQIYI